MKSSTASRFPSLKTSVKNRRTSVSLSIIARDPSFRPSRRPGRYLDAPSTVRRGAGRALERRAQPSRHRRPCLESLLLRRLVRDLQRIRDRQRRHDEAGEPGRPRGGHVAHAISRGDPEAEAIGADEELTRRIAQPGSPRLLLDLARASRPLVLGERGAQEARDLVLGEEAAELVGGHAREHHIAGADPLWQPLAGRAQRYERPPDRDP